MKPGTLQLLLQFKCLADPVRLRLFALCRRGECSVSELTHAIGQSQPRVSQHLRQLCDAGLLERFRDGKRVYYRLPASTGRAAAGGRLMALVPDDDPDMLDDAERLWRLRGSGLRSQDHRDDPVSAPVDRAVHRLLLELTVTAPIGDLLDIGCGRGGLLKLLASRANRVVGVDVDADARQFARAELMLAGFPNCSLRFGDMYRLPFADAEFDTIVLDDVLADARYPVRALSEAKRLLRQGGRLFILQSLQSHAGLALQKLLAGWSGAAGLRLTPARFAPEGSPEWLLCVATGVDAGVAAA